MPRKSPNRPGKPGRPSKFTAEARERILAAVEMGATREIAAQAAEVSTSTLYEWVAKGTRDQTAGLTTEFSEFVDALTHARAKGEVQGIAEIQFAAQTDWRARAWLMERTAPTRWGKRRITDDQVSEIRAAERQRVYDEIDAQLRQLPEDAQRLLSDALRGATTPRGKPARLEA